MSEESTSRQKVIRGVGSFLFTTAIIFLLVLPLHTCSFADTLEDTADDYPGIFNDLGRQLEEYYWDKRRFQPDYQLRRALSALENSADEIYVDYAGENKDRVRVHIRDHYKVLRISDVNTLASALKVLEEIFRFLEPHYDGERSLNDVRISTVNGFLTGLDPHTLVFGRSAFEDFYVHIEGEIGGVGMLVGNRGKDGKLTVIEVLKGTPAFQSGFKKGDLIAKIGAESTINMSVGEAVKKIRGERGSKVKLTIKRKVPDEDKLVTLEKLVTRERVVIKSVESKLLENGIGYIQVTNFDKNTVTNLRANLERLRMQNGDKPLSGLVLDLRGNSGGLLKQASDMADTFLKQGVVYSIADRQGVSPNHAKDTGKEPIYPIIALGNRDSASGAEIVVGSLQQNDRAVVLGTKTFGKGSVQQLHALPPHLAYFRKYKAQLKITVSEYLIPNETSIQENGVVPDILAEPVIVAKEIVDYFPNRRMTEKDYKNHIVSKYAKDLKPSERFRYAFVPDEADTDGIGDAFHSGDIEPMKDKLVQIAVKLLDLERESSASGVNPEPFNRKRFLEKHRGAFDSIRKELADEVVKLLGEHDIDWSPGETTVGDRPNVDFKLSHELISRPSEDEDDPYAEEVLQLRATITNRSDRPIYRLVGLSVSDQFAYNEREFLFGKLEPGQTIERTDEIILRPSSATRSDVVAVKLSCPAFDEPIASVTHEVVIPGKDFPILTYALSLRDGTDQPITRLSTGTDVRVSARIKNLGKTELKKGIAILKNHTGKEIFLETGRLELLDLGPNETQELTFKFKVQNEPQLDSYKFEFGVFDSYYPSGLSREFEIPGAGAKNGEFANDVWLRAPSLSMHVAYESNGTEREHAADSIIVTDQESIELKAEVIDKLPFSAWVLTSNLNRHDDALPDKISFAESHVADDGNLLELKAAVPLQIGQNVISVVARNDGDLTQRRIVFVRRLAKNPKTATNTPEGRTSG